MSERSQRLKQARAAAGYTSASAAARQMDLSISTYAAHENGGRAFSTDDATLYAKHFGVSLDWLLTGIGDSGGARSSHLRGTPVVGTLSFQTWSDRPPLDLYGSFSETIEITVSAGGDNATWFAVSVSEGLEGNGYHFGDYLLARESHDAPVNSLCIVERTGFGGALRQLVPAKSVVVDGMNVLTFPTDPKPTHDRPVDADSRILGVVEALYRPL